MHALAIRIAIREDCGEERTFLEASPLYASLYFLLTCAPSAFAHGLFFFFFF
jgi:hypothetical protein